MIYVQLMAIKSLSAFKDCTVKVCNSVFVSKNPTSLLQILMLAIAQLCFTSCRFHWVGRQKASYMIPYATGLSKPGAFTLYNEQTKMTPFVTTSSTMARLLEI